MNTALSDLDMPCLRKTFTYLLTYLHTNYLLDLRETFARDVSANKEELKDYHASFVSHFLLLHLLF